MTSNSARQLAEWMSKFVIGWVIVETIAFVLLAALFKLPFDQLWTPYLALLVPGIITGLLVLNATAYRAQRPKSFSARLAIAVLVCLLLCLLIGSYYGVKLNLFSRDLMGTVVVVGFLGAIVMSFNVYHRMNRRQGMRKPDSQ